MLPYAILSPQQILLSMCSKLLQKVPMFEDLDKNFMNAVLVKLRYEVFQEGDVIFRLNSPGDRMYLIDHGQVSVETDSVERELCDGDYFGGGFKLQGHLYPLGA